MNGWLERDDRRFFIRALRGSDGRTGVARAWLSDGYKKIGRAGHPVQIETCDLTDRRMYVRARCEAVQVLAPGLLAGYRSPFTGAAGADNPVVFAGFVVTNSETGCGACTVTPRIEVHPLGELSPDERDRRVHSVAWALSAKLNLAKARKRKRTLHA